MNYIQTSRVINDLAILFFKWKNILNFEKHPQFYGK